MAQTCLPCVRADLHIEHAQLSIVHHRPSRHMRSRARPKLVQFEESHHQELKATVHSKLRRVDSVAREEPGGREQPVVSTQGNVLRPVKFVGKTG